MLSLEKCLPTYPFALRSNVFLDLVLKVLLRSEASVKGIIVSFIYVSRISNSGKEQMIDKMLKRRF